MWLVWFISLLAFVFLKISQGLFLWKDQSDLSVDIAKLDEDKQNILYFVQGDYQYSLNTIYESINSFNIKKNYINGNALIGRITRAALQENGDDNVSINHDNVTSTYCCDQINSYYKQNKSKHQYIDGLQSMDFVTFLSLLSIPIIMYYFYKQN